MQQEPIRYVNATDPSCGGHSPCHLTIQAAVDAVQPGETILIQAGTYIEEVLVHGRNNTSGLGESDRIVIEADPAAPLGSVVLAGADSNCNTGYALRFEQSKYITVRGLTIIGAGSDGVALLGGVDGNQAIHLERLRIFANGFGSGSSGCGSGIRIGRGNAETLITNSIVYGNGRDGIETDDGDGGPHYISWRCLRTSIRRTTAAGVPSRPRRRLCGWRRARASVTRSTRTSSSRSASIWRRVASQSWYVSAPRPQKLIARPVAGAAPTRGTLPGSGRH